MFNLLIRGSLRARALVLVVASLLIIYGGVSLNRIPVDVFPDLNKTSVVVMTEAGGLSPEEVERIVTFPIEISIAGTPGVTRVRSASAVGLSIVYVEFDWNSNVYLSRQQVAERLSIARDRLPPTAQPQMMPITSIMGEIMLIALSGDGISPMDLRDIGDWVVRPRILSIPGIAQVIPIGGEVRQFRVTPKPGDLAAYGVTKENIERAIADFSANSGGGFIDQRGREFIIRNIGRTLSLDVLRDLVVDHRAGRPVLLRQVATVDYAPHAKRGDAGYMGEPAVILTVQKQPAANTIELTRQIEAAMADLARSMPRGVKVDNYLFKQSHFIEASIGNLKSVLVDAVIVVSVILFLFLLNVRTTIISLTAIPISILITIIVFEILGLSINTMTIGGIAIAIGELVDDAVVDVENIFRRLRENRLLPDPRPVMDVVIAASQEVRSGIFYATMIIVLVFVPLFALTGLEGRLFRPLGVAYIVAILASLVTAVTVIPVLSYYMLPGLKRLGHGDSWLVTRLKVLNARLLRWAFPRAAMIWAGAAALVLVSVVGLASLPRSFMPPFNEGTLTMALNFNPGISLRESNRLGLLAERLLLEIPEVVTVGRRVGRAELDEHAEGVHAAEIDVDLKPSDRDRQAVQAAIREKLAVLPATLLIGQPISHRLDHMQSGIRAQIAVKVFGDDLETIAAVAERVRLELAKIPGIVDLGVERVTRVPQVRVVADPERALLYGITPADITRSLEHLANGRIVSQVIDGTRRYDVVLRLADDNRTSEGLDALLIETPAGRIPLSHVATVEDTDGPNQVLRENGRRRIVVVANSDGSSMTRIIADVRRALEQVRMPPGYFTSLEGAFRAQEEATQRIALLSCVSLTLIFIVLYTRYRSLALTLIIMACVPFALVGGVLALVLAGQPLSVASMIGFITLTGIAARNGILKVSHYINLILHEGERFGPGLVIRGSLERMTPVLMTASAAGFALLPLIVDADTPGREILSPVALVIFGGLISATILDAVLTPTLFLRYGRGAIERLTSPAAAPASGAAPLEAY
ncbi:efflux RND transporter permease subunit [Stella sp.]|uniref:efflux RND transporter permease subunit n=1 Tax=Stella sp. TaxID=2912054 RepID=UPI0035B2DDDF